jgi:hypothetical protein
MSERPVFTELDACMEQLVIAEKRARDAERKAHRLERLLNEVPEDAPDAGEILELLDLWWQRVKNSNPNVAHGLDSTRAAKVRTTLKRRKKLAKDEGLDPSYGMLMCRKAIIGITLDDWAMGRNPKSGGKAFNDIAEHILNTDNDVEKFAALFDEWCSHLTMQPLPREEAVSIQQARSRREQSTARQHQRWEQERREDPAEAMLAALTRGGWEWRCKPRDGWEAQCPAHQGHDLKLSIDWNSSGDRLLVKCWSRDCETAEVMAALDLPLYTLFKNPKEKAA